jgi:hypothetical protein
MLESLGIYLKLTVDVEENILALNLTRVQTLAQNRMDSTIATHLIRKSQFFIE